MPSYRPLLNHFVAVLCLVLLTVTASFAQEKEKIKMKPTEGKLSSTVRSKAYYYPQFQAGKVSFISGVVSSATLNYNMLTGEVEFINARKDTLAVDNMYLIKLITIGTDSFYYDAESTQLLKLVDDISGRKLLVKEKYALADVKNVGAMGVESSTASPTNTTNTDFRQTQNKLKSNESMIFSARSYYYFGVQDKYLPATKGNFLKLFPQHSDKLKSYMKENNLDLKSKEEIQKLLQYASGL
ncbi:hypothetical protein WG947_16660 [Pontibacter sp. H259]|uniref:hypothetical protein n=1 Tax=Pontibacter sp. H259 TaxID=3133421 RepID=UPI0030C46479